MQNLFHCKTSPSVVYLVVEDDCYELPIFLAESIKELQWYFGISNETAIDMILNEKTRFGLKVEIVVLEE